MSGQPNNGAMNGGDFSGMNGQNAMGGGSGIDGSQNGPAPGPPDGSNPLLAQQQALMAMAGGAAPGGFDAGASREALMNLLARQGFGGGAGMQAPMGGMQPGMAMSMQPGMQMGMLGDGNGTPSDAQAAQMMGMQGMMGGMGGMGMMNGMMGGMMGNNLMGGGAGSVLGSSNLLGAGGGNASGEGNKMGDGSGRGGGVIETNPAMAQQNMLIQQMLQQQAAAAGGGGLWQQYGNMPGAGGMMGDATGGAGLGAGYLGMLGQGAGSSVGQAREAGDTGVFQTGALPDFAKSGKKSRPKKPKNKPKRPLSAYNIFFKDERAKILSGIPDKKGEDGEDEDEENKTKKEDGEEKSDEKDEDGDQEGEDGKKASGKKRKRVPHGKIGFESLAKIVGQRWKELPPEDLEIYKKRAEEDMKRYRKEMEAYVQKQREGLEQSREHLEKLVDEETKKRYFGDAAGGV